MLLNHSRFSSQHPLTAFVFLASLPFYLMSNEFLHLSGHFPWVNFLSFLSNLKRLLIIEFQTPGNLVIKHEFYVFQLKKWKAREIDMLWMTHNLLASEQEAILRAEEG